VEDAVKPYRIGFINLQIKKRTQTSKVLIFTEFVLTQEMLWEFLSDRGISVVRLNGSMGNGGTQTSPLRLLAKRSTTFISTDAGGEGSQFCHVVLASHYSGTRCG